ncbi:HxlR family transcriptional regulator [Paramesorhizobium deserti]|uniref:HxlR family transcriptional regulator n=1 Tax=Paramesorhizobium deserti TaxID=1494590 RepID=A0A135HXW5_9HYPH|nr:helix-turn-helix domain-containing protein [Paramesorhizobium deserti]KXF77998.1 HxlR family transcriptional regulator [Paramesorhizobium deserti]
MRCNEPDDCGFTSALQAIGGKWKTSLLWALHLRPHRFAELRRLLPGISEKVLTQQLRQMEADGLISRHDYKEVPPRVEYSVTSLGLSLNDAVTAMSKWGKQHEVWKARPKTAA